MAYFAQVDDTNTVTQVIKISNDACGEPFISFPETEPNGQAFIRDVLGLPGTWLQTSYNGSFRGYYAGIGFTYDSTLDEFVPTTGEPLDE